MYNIKYKWFSPYASFIKSGSQVRVDLTSMPLTHVTGVPTQPYAFRPGFHKVSEFMYYNNIWNNYFTVYQVIS